MMLDVTNNDEGPGGEGSHLLLSSASAASLSSHHNSLPYAIFSDLTYSDDEENEDAWDAEYSSPDTAALMEEILSDAMFHQERQDHLIHPLALQRGGSEADEASTLAYSITSTAVGDDDEGGSRGSMSTTPTGGYGALDSLASSPSFGFVKPKPKPNIFRPPSPAFERSPRPPPQAQYAQQYSYWEQQQDQQRSYAPITTTLRPKRTREVPAHQPPPANNTYAGGTGRQHRPPSPDSGNNVRNKFQHQHALVTPLPFRTDDSSPTTSATAGDSRTPPDRRRGHAHSPSHEDEEMRRMRRNKRLGRIRRAAEAREAAVREVRGSDQRGGGRCRDVPFAFAFLCQFLLVSMSALAFAPGALRDKVYGPLDPAGGVVIGEAKGGSKTGSVGDFNPFAGTSFSWCASRAVGPDSARS